MNARTDTIIRITPVEYREFAEIAKASGMVLRLFDQPTEIIGPRTGNQAGRRGVEPSVAEARGRRDPRVCARLECCDGRRSASRGCGKPS
jgi:hypothetical protein